MSMNVDRVVTYDAFLRQVEHASVLDGELYVQDGKLVKTNYGGLLTRTFSTNARTVLQKDDPRNRQARQAFCDAIKGKLGLNENGKNSFLDFIKEKLGVTDNGVVGGVGGVALSRRTIKVITGTVAKYEKNKETNDFNSLFESALKEAFTDSQIKVMVTRSCGRSKELFHDLTTKGQVRNEQKASAYDAHFKSVSNEITGKIVGPKVSGNNNAKSDKDVSFLLKCKDLDEGSVAEAMREEVLSHELPEIGKTTESEPDDKQYLFYSEQVKQKIEEKNEHIREIGQIAFSDKITFEKGVYDADVSQKQNCVSLLIADLFANGSMSQYDKCGTSSGERLLQTFAQHYELFEKLLTATNEEQDADVSEFYQMLDNLSREDMSLKTKMKSLIENLKVELGLNAPNATLTHYMIFTKADTMARVINESNIEVEIDHAAQALASSVGNDIAEKLLCSMKKQNGESDTAAVNEIASFGEDYKKLSEIYEMKEGGNGTFIQEQFKSYIGGLDSKDARYIIANTIRHGKNEGLKVNDKGKKPTVKVDRGAFLKSVGPSVAKLLQGVPTQYVTDEALKAELGDMKDKMFTIEKEVVEAELYGLMKQNNHIKKIDVVSVLGCASVGQTLKVKILYKNGKDETAAVKLIRPEAYNRLNKEIGNVESKIKNGNAGNLVSWRGRMDTFKPELDLTNEANNIKLGMGKYGKQSVNLIDGINPTQTCMVMKFGEGDTVKKVCADAEDLIDAFQKKKEEIDKKGKSDSQLNSKIDDFDDRHQERRKELNKLNIIKIGGKDVNRKDAIQNVRSMFVRLKKTSFQLQEITKNWLSGALDDKNSFFHGDLHSGNMLVDANGNVMLIDFGNADKIKDKKILNPLYLIAASNGENLKTLPARFLLAYNDAYGDGENHDAITDLLNSPAKRMMLEGGLYKIFQTGNSSFEKYNLALKFMASHNIPIPNKLYSFAQAGLRLRQAVDEVQDKLKKLRSLCCAFNIYGREFLGDDEKGAALRMTNMLGSDNWTDEDLSNVDLQDGDMDLGSLDLPDVVHKSTRWNGIKSINEATDWNFEKVLSNKLGSNGNITTETNKASISKGANDDEKRIDNFELYYRFSDDLKELGIKDATAFLRCLENKEVTVDGKGGLLYNDNELKKNINDAVALNKANLFIRKYGPLEKGDPYFMESKVDMNSLLDNDPSGIHEYAKKYFKHKADFYGKCISKRPDEVIANLKTWKDKQEKIFALMKEIFVSLAYAQHTDQDEAEAALKEYNNYLKNIQKAEKDILESKNSSNADLMTNVEKLIGYYNTISELLENPLKITA